MDWKYKIIYFQNGMDAQYQGWNVDGKIQQSLRGLPMHEMLDSFGADGWELVSVAISGDDPDPCFYFKRPKYPSTGER